MIAISNDNKQPKGLNPMEKTFQYLPPIQKHFSRKMSANQPNGAANGQPASTLLSLHSTLRSLYRHQSDLYQALTFPTLLVTAGQIIPIVLAVEEDFEYLRMDVQRFAPLPFGFGQPNLRVLIYGVFDVYLHAGNVSALMRYLKERGAGIDCIVVEPQGGMIWTRPGEEIQQDGFDHFGFDPR